MSTLKRFFVQQPLISAIIGIAVMFLFSVLLSDTLGETIPKFIVSIPLLALIVAIGWGRESGITRPMKDWNKRWWVATIPFIVIIVINLTGFDYGTFTFTPSDIIKWLTDNFATGLFEESMLRAFAFYIMYRAWGQTQSGVIKAGIASATIFGLLHYLNLTTGAPFFDVTLQVVLALLIGIGFAGFVAYAKTIWPAVILHAAIDAAGAMEEFFGPEATGVTSATSTGNSLGDAAGLFIVITVAVVLPGLWLLYKADLHPEVNDDDATL